MIIQEIKAKSILLKHSKIDSWFVSRYGMNLYRGCIHNCAYCDGRSERYHVDGAFGENVAVKINAIPILRKELHPLRKRVKLKPSFILLGGGVGDSYQPVEEKYRLTRKALHLLYEYNWPVHILTKSALVARDMDLIRKINHQNRAIVSFSFSSIDDNIGRIYEPFASPPTERLEALRLFKKEGIATGMFLLPVIPFITDTSNAIEEALRKAKEIGVDFVIFGGLTLKTGVQKDFFYNLLNEMRSDLLPKYKEIYKETKWGQAASDYYENINSIFNKKARDLNISTRMPLYLFSDILWENDLVIVILEHLDYFLRLEGKRSSYGYAAYQISKLSKPLSSIKSNLRKISGVGEKTESIILEILETKNSSIYTSLAIN